MKRLLLATVAAFTMTVPAMAIPLLLEGPQPGHTIGPQSTSNPCVIAGTTCQQPSGFGYNQYTPNNDPAYNRYSTQDAGNGVNVADGVQGTPYTVGQLTGIVGATFNIAIDVNTTGAASEVLQLFEVIDTTSHTTLYSYTGPTPIGNVNANGNGYGDWLLSTVNLAGLPSTDGILFHAQWSNAVDGAESFFLISAVPGPIAGAGLPSLLAGCFGLWLLAKRRRGQRTDLVA